MNVLKPTDLIADGAEKVEGRIAQLWNDAAVMLEEGAMSEDAFRSLAELDAAIDPDDPLSRWVWSHALARYVAHPDEVGATDAELYECRTCLAGAGWIERVDLGGLIPCPACRARGYELWRGGHFKPNHTCSECQPGARKRGKAGASDHDEQREERREKGERQRADTEASVF